MLIKNDTLGIRYDRHLQLYVIKDQHLNAPAHLDLDCPPRPSPSNQLETS